MSKDIGFETFRDLVPKKQRSMVTQELVDKLNKFSNDPELMDGFKDSVLGYIGVLNTGKYKLDDYINAVRFVSYKLLGKSNIDSWATTFPDRYQRLVDMGKSRDDIAPHSTKYNGTKLVVSIFEQTLVPTHVLNAPLFQDALNVLAGIMVSSRSDIARVNAANAILANTKAPEVSKIELDIGLKPLDSIADLRKATENLAIAELQSIEAGVAVKTIAERTIVDVEVEDE